MASLFLLPVRFVLELQYDNLLCPSLSNHLSLYRNALYERSSELKVFFPFYKQYLIKQNFLPAFYRKLLYFKFLPRGHNILLPPGFYHSKHIPHLKQNPPKSQHPRRGLVDRGSCLGVYAMKPLAFEKARKGEGP